MEEEILMKKIFEDIEIKNNFSSKVEKFEIMEVISVLITLISTVFFIVFSLGFVCNQGNLFNLILPTLFIIISIKSYNFFYEKDEKFRISIINEKFSYFENILLPLKKKVFKDYIDKSDNVKKSEEILILLGKKQKTIEEKEKIINLIIKLEKKYYEKILKEKNKEEIKKQYKLLNENEAEEKEMVLGKYNL